MTFHVALLNDWRVYREIRLRALQTNPEVFCSTYAREVAWTEEQWQERLNDRRCAIFGVYCADELVGMTGIYKNEAGQGVLWGSWLDPRVRGKGASEAMYRARLAWAREQGVQCILVSHRESNEASRRANQRHGFRWTHSAPRTWPDGKEELELCYELRFGFLSAPPGTIQP